MKLRPRPLQGGIEKREIYQVKHPAAKAILAEFKDDPSLNRVFHSLYSIAKELKGDREAIREYLKGLNLAIIVVMEIFLS
jgi:hypothetical protein